MARYKEPQKVRELKFQIKRFQKLNRFLQKSNKPNINLYERNKMFIDYAKTRLEEVRE